MRRWRLVPALVAAAALAAGIWAACARQGSPSVLLVTIDTLRADRVGCYGDAQAVTPVLDKLAREGVLFERAYTPVPLTLPSHATILTGRHPSRHGVRNNGTYHLPSEAQTLAESFRLAGYRTGAFVSSFVLHRQFGLEQGFDAYDDSLFNERAGTRTVERALEWVRGGGKRPFFLWVHLFEPHTPWNPPAPYASLPLRSGYEREVAAADGALGQLLDGLEEDRLLRNTVVAVLSDHGEGLDDHGEFEHGIFLYEEAVRVPWLLRLPQGEGGRRVADLVSTADLAPTLLELVDAPRLPEADGVSLAGLLDGGDLPTRHGVPLETLYPEQNFGWAPLHAFVTPGWKWVRAPESELYDLRGDPKERANLASARPDTAERLDRRLERFLQSSVADAGAVSSASREVTERLRSLGYLSAAGLTTAGAESLPDPKRMIGSHADLEAAKRAVDDRRFAEAIPPFERVLELQGRNLVALLGLGMALNRTGEFERAERTYERALAVSPQNATALGGLAEAISGQERWADAIQLYQLAGRDPQQARTAESRIAFCLDRLGRHEEALARLEAAEQARPADRQHFRDLAGRLADYRRLAADPAQSDSLRLSRARVAAALGWLAEAERMLRPPASNPEGERARLRMLETLETELGRPQRALAVLDQLVRLEGPSAFTAVRRATLLLSAGRSAEAVDAFARLQDAELSRDGLLAAARYNEACALMRLGRHDEALAALGRAVQAGYDRLGVLLNDHDLAPLREDARFAALVETISARSGNADSPNAQAD